MRHLQGEMYPSNPRGECVHYENGLCAIQDVKPFECAEYMHGDDRDESASRHRGISEAWAEAQDMIENADQLRGRMPDSGGFFGFY